MATRRLWAFFWTYVDLSTYKLREFFHRDLSHIPEGLMSFLKISGGTVAGSVALMLLGYIMIGLWGYVSPSIPVQVLSAFVGRYTILNTLAACCAVGIIHVLVVVVVMVCAASLWERIYETYKRAWIITTLRETGYFLISHKLESGLVYRQLILIAKAGDVGRDGARFDPLAATEQDGHTEGLCFKFISFFRGAFSIERVDPVDLPLYVGYAYTSEHYRRLLSTMGHVRGEV